jgi:SAM-dependent methyltransferase
LEDLDSVAAAQLGCPICRASGLVAEPAALRCSSCGARFPHAGGLPCVMKDTASWRASWRQHALEFEQETILTLAHWQAELAPPEVLPRTRARLERLIEGKKRELGLLAPLFAELKNEAPREELQVAPRARSRLAVFDCYENVFRDWCWGGEESRRLVSLGAPLGRAPRERVAVYGAGAARFALELHRELAPKWTFALDQNPLPLWLAQRVLSGEVVELHEYPVSPVYEKNAVLLQQLRTPVPSPAGLRLLLADALQPPFAADSLDLVVTPWFVDVCGADLRVVAQDIHRVLRQGGTWWILGPLDFDTWLSRAYCFEEMLELVEQGGFDVAHSESTNLPYFQSPFSGSQRIDTVVSIIATKTRSADPYASWLAQLDPALRLALLGQDE